MPQRFRNVLKICVSVAFIAALLLLLGSEEMLVAFRRLTMGDLLTVTLLCSISLALLAKRFQRVLLRGAIRESWLSVYGLQIMGLTINHFMPGLYGGDLLRIAYYMPAYGDKKRFLTAAVFFERICGLLAMTCVGLLSSGFAGLFWGESLWLVMAGLLLAGSVALVLFGRWLFARKLTEMKLPRWLSLSSDVVTELACLFGKRKLVFETVLLSLFSQAVSILLYWWLLRSLGAELSFPAVAAVVSLGWLVTLVPVSLNGLGVREGGLVIGFLSFGIARSAALTVSLTALLPTLIHALLGSLLLVWNMEKITRLRKLVYSG